jgi:hypothetical protein
MSYDDGRWTAVKQYGPIFGSFAQVIATTTTKVQTSSNVTDRVEFMRKIKATGFKFLTKTGTTQGGSQSGMAYSVRLMAGSDIIATAPLLGSADDGLMADGVIVASNASKIAADEALSLVWRITPSGTAHTSALMSGEAYLEYQTSYL